MDPPSVYGQSHKTVIADMLAAIQENRPPRTNGLEARKSVALVLAMYESARRGCTVEMSDSPWSRKA